MRAAGWIATAGAAALLAACATPTPPPVAEAPLPAPAPEAEPAPPAPERPRLESAPLKHLANRRLEPIPTRPLNVNARCAFKDPTGYRGRLNLSVREADVRQFDAQISVPRKGSCKFSLREGFRQTHNAPVVAMNNPRDDCTVRMWEQGGQVTVAFRDCKARCSGESFDYVWPILVDARTGKCS